MRAAKTGTKINGKNMTGFITIGKPKTTGSLTLKRAGKAATLPKALYCLDLAAKIIATTKPKVIPDPERIKKESKNCWVTIWAPLSKDRLPAANKALLASKLDRRRAVTIPLTTDCPCTPNHQRKEIKKAMPRAP